MSKSQLISIRTFPSALSFAALLSSACGAQPPEDTASIASIEQHGETYFVPKNNDKVQLCQAYAADRGTPEILRGIELWYTASDGTQYWYVMGDSYDYRAPVSSIQYRGQSVKTLSTNQGWFVITTADGVTTTLNTSSARGYQGTTAYYPLELTVGYPYSRVLKISPNLDGDSYGMYRWFYTAGGVDTALCKVYKYYPCYPGPTCLSQVDTNIIPVAGYKWNLTTGQRTSDVNAISFGSTEDAVGGCVSWGYKPWDGYLGSVRCGNSWCFGWISNADHHQACTRAKRGDFCGDGRSFTGGHFLTNTGVTVQVWDSLNIHQAAPQTRDTMESYFDINGATCVNGNRMRTTPMDDANGSVFDPATTCGQAKPTCSGTSYSGRIGIGRPCTQNTDGTWACP